MGEKKEKKQMNKKVFIIGGIAVAIVIVAIIVGCIIANNKKVSIAGNYELVEMYDDEDSYSAEDLETLKKFGLSVYFELREDGTGTLDLFGETMELTYDENNMLYEDEDGDGTEEIPYTVDGETLTLEKDGSKLVFQKADTTDNSE